ncbi:hypothetical protein [Streptomyces sp. NPDC001536]|uniref:hypothetical protein n=1 Tax=Streptomyces sp. NPDC001536 TaxID=3364583 RepID=UPI003679E8D6
MTVRTPVHIDLTEVSTQVITVDRPFSFKTTVSKPSHFPTPLESFPEPGTYLVTLHVGDDLYGLRARDVGPETVELTLYAPEDVPQDRADTVTTEAARRLGLLVDLSGYEDIWSHDSRLRALPTELAGGRPAMPHSLYGFLMICVFLQNTNVRRTVQMMKAMTERFSPWVRFPDGTVLPALWSPQTIAESSEEELRSLKVGYRARTIDRLSRQFAESPGLEAELLAMTDPEALRQGLLGLYGVGPATVGYLSYAWFKQLDDLVYVAPWECKILGRLLLDRPDAQSPELIAEARARWSPYTMQALNAVFESVFWKRAEGVGPAWLDELILL